jgi:hypothetical protein
MYSKNYPAYAQNRDARLNRRSPLFLIYPTYAKLFKVLVKIPLLADCKKLLITLTTVLAIRPVLQENLEIYPTYTEITQEADRNTAAAQP